MLLWSTSQCHSGPPPPDHPREAITESSRSEVKITPRTQLLHPSARPSISARSSSVQEQPGVRHSHRPPRSVSSAIA